MKAAGTYGVTMTATWPCASGPGIQTLPPTVPAPSLVARHCQANAINNSEDAWSAYGVSNFALFICYS